MKKTRLAVFFGGRSCEHDVSVITGLQALANAQSAKYDAFPVYMAQNGHWYTGQALRSASAFAHFNPATAQRCVLLQGEAGAELIAWPPRKKMFFASGVEVISGIDVALTCMHGMNGEDGTLQGLLELYDIPYTSSGMLGSSVGMDKIAQKQLLKSYGLPVLPMAKVTRNRWQREAQAVLDEVEVALCYPMFVKPANLGSSIGISRAQDRASLHEAIQVACAFDRHIIVEQGIDDPKEINCSALGYGEDVRTSPCEMPVAWQEFLTFEDKYMRGGKDGAKGSKGGMANLQRRIPAPISDEMTQRIQTMTRDTFCALDMKGVVRADFLLDENKGEVYLNEVNTIPGSLAFYLWEAVGISFPQLIDQLVDYALIAHDEKKASTYTYDSGILRNFAKGSKGGKTQGGAKA